MSNLRICYMGPLPPFRGGSGTVGGMLVKALVRQGCEVVAVSFLGAGDTGLDPSLQAAGVVVRAVPVALDTNPWDQPDVGYLEAEAKQLAVAARDILSGVPPDVVLVGRGDYGVPAMTIAHECRCPFVVIDHGSASAHYAGLGTVPEPFRPHHVLERAASIVSVAPHRTEVLRECGFSTVVTIPNGTDTSLFRPGAVDDRLRRRYGIAPGTCLVAHVSNFSPVKRVADLLKASALLRAADVDVHVLVVGDGPSRQALQAEARALALDGRTTFTGWLEARELAQLLHSIDLVVQPSAAEACPLAVLEAMSSGCPVVASDVRGHREMIAHGITGLLVPTGDAQAMATTIADVAASPERRKTIGTAAHQAVRHRTTDAMAEAYDAVLFKCAGAGH